MPRCRWAPSPCRNGVYDAIVDGAPAGIELFHGYTYSGHPLAAAAAIATMELHRAEDLPGRARAIEPYWQEAAHSLRGLAQRDRHPRLRPDRRHRAGAARRARPGQRAMDVFRRCFDAGVLVRVTGDIVALSPPLIVEKPHVDRLIGTLDAAIRAEAA